MVEDDVLTIGMDIENDGDYDFFPLCILIIRKSISGESNFTSEDQYILERPVL